MTTTKKADAPPQGDNSPDKPSDTPEDLHAELARLRAENEQLNDDLAAFSTQHGSGDDSGQTEVRLIIVSGSGAFTDTKSRIVKVATTADGIDRTELDKVIGRAFKAGAVNVEEICAGRNVIHHADTFAAVS